MGKGKISNSNCSVYGCHTRRQTHPNVNFHRYPEPNSGTANIINKFGIIEKIDRRQAWFIKLKMGKPIGKRMLVCSKHFTEDDYFVKGAFHFNRILKKTAVPSVNLPQSSVQVKRKENTRRVARFENLQELRNANPASTVTSTGVASETDPLAMEYCLDNETEQMNNNLISIHDLSQKEKDCVDVLLNLDQKKSMGKFSDMQKEALVDFLIENKSLMLAKPIRGLVTDANIVEMWEALSKLLNNLAGAKKDWRQWRKTWLYIKTKTKDKLRKPKLEIGAECLTEVDKKIISLIYPSAVSQAVEMYGHADIEEPEIDINYAQIDEFKEEFNSSESVDEPIEPYYVEIGTKCHMELPPLIPIGKSLPVLNEGSRIRMLSQYYKESAERRVTQIYFEEPEIHIKHEPLDVNDEEFNTCESVDDTIKLQIELPPLTPIRKSIPPLIEDKSIIMKIN